MTMTDATKNIATPIAVVSRPSCREHFEEQRFGDEATRSFSPIIGGDVSGYESSIRVRKFSAMIRRRNFIVKGMTIFSPQQFVYS